MTELIKRLERLFLKLDHTALLVEQSLADAMVAVESGKDEDTEIVIHADEAIDRREVETERECIRMLALFQPTAIDLRRICFVVKANSDLERIADYCVKIAKRGRRMKKEGVSLTAFPAFFKLAEQVGDTFRHTMRLFSLHSENEGSEAGVECNVAAARSVIASDNAADELFREFLDQTLAAEEMFHGRLKVWYDLTALGRSLERIGDLCANIAEDAIFMFSGEIIRHHLAGTSEDSSDIDD